MSCEHHRWQKRPPSIQSSAGERSLKARRHCFVPPGHVSEKNARTEWINCAVLISGEKPGRGTIFLHLIRILGEISRTADDFCGLHPGTRGGIPDEQYTLAAFCLFYDQAVSKNDVFPCFSIPLGNFLPKTVPRCIARGVIEVGATRYWAFRVAPSTPGRIRGLLLGAACEGAT